MGSKRPKNGRTGKKKGDKDTKGQRSMLEYTVKKTGDGGQALQDHVNELQRQLLARANKPRDKASQDDFDESKLQVCHQKNDKQY